MAPPMGGCPLIGVQLGGPSALSAAAVAHRPQQPPWLAHDVPVVAAGLGVGLGVVVAKDAPRNPPLVAHPVRTGSGQRACLCGAAVACHIVSCHTVSCHIAPRGRFGTGAAPCSLATALVVDSLERSSPVSDWPAVACHIAVVCHSAFKASSGLAQAMAGARANWARPARRLEGRRLLLLVRALAARAARARGCAAGRLQRHRSHTGKPRFFFCEG